MPEQNTAEAGTKEDQLEAMARSGEIELMPEEPAETSEVPEGQPQSIKVGGREFKEQELETIIAKAESVDNTDRFQKANTQRAMALSEERTAFEAERARVRAEFDEMRKNANGDAVTEKLIAIQEQQMTRQMALEQTNLELKQQLQVQKDMTYFQLEKSKAEAELGEKLPEIGTPEFDRLVLLAANGNRLKMAYQATKNSKSPRMPDITSSATQPAVDQLSSEEEAAIKASGISRESYLSHRGH